jgi:ketosteroid isomerase-like protein
VKDRVDHLRVAMSQGQMRADVIRRFYECFARHDAEGMAACYADDVVFSDPVFQHLRGRDAGDMWRMLCERAKGDLVVVASDIAVDESGAGHARWVARYHFGPARRTVMNQITATFRFDGNDRIVEHTDRFDLWRWSRMALGLPGILLGWSPLLQNKVRAQANQGLKRFQDQRMSTRAPSTH